MFGQGGALSRGPRGGSFLPLGAPDIPWLVDASRPAPLSPFPFTWPPNCTPPFLSPVRTFVAFRAHPKPTMISFHLPPQKPLSK